MRIKKISEKHILEQLNKKSWANVSEKDDILIWDGEYTNSLTNGLDEEQLREQISNGKPFQVAREVTGITPDDLQDENFYDVDRNFSGEDFLLDMLAPCTEGEWEFKDIFNVNDKKLLQQLYDELYKAAITFIKISPRILSESGGFRKGAKWSYFIKPKGRKYRAATADEVATFLQEESEEKRTYLEGLKKAEAYKEALARVSLQDRITLGIC